MARWLEALSEVIFTTLYRQGSKHGNADGLSRHSCLKCKQCDRLMRLNGGPSLGHTKIAQKIEIPVCVRVVGEQLYTTDLLEDIADNAANHIPLQDEIGDVFGEQHCCALNEESMFDRGESSQNLEYLCIKLIHQAKKILS